MNPATIILAFVTGLTTGGLSCFAVQGGLLTSSIASYAEQNSRQASGAKGKKPSRMAVRSVQEARAAQAPVAAPILLFLGTKLAVHAVFGFLLGWLGTILTPSPVARGILQIVVALFMIGNALRMFNVHPFFRIFSLEPPKFITRVIRRRSKRGQEWATPVFLGALTILIPCGITQVMMAAAVSSGNPLAGSALLTAFILGASPAFFAVTYLATRVSALFERHFLRVMAVVILLLGLFTLDTGLNLAGSPFSITRAVAAWQDGAPDAGLPAASAAQTGGSQDGNIAATLSAISPGLGQSLAGPEADSAAAPQEVAGAAGQDLTINVKNSGYLPRVSYAPAGQAVRVRLVTSGVYSCSRAFVIPSLNYSQLLPATGEVSLEIPAQTAGTRLRYMCSMGMYTGEICFQ